MIRLALIALLSPLIINHSVAALDKESITKDLKKLERDLALALARGNDYSDLFKRSADLALRSSGIAPDDFGVGETHGEATAFYNEKIKGFVAYQSSWTPSYETTTNVIKYDDGRCEISTDTTPMSTDFSISISTPPNPAVVSLLESKIAELKAASTGGK